MNEQKRQSVSNLMDNEMSSDAEINELVRNPEMRSIWSRYHLVRDLLQGEVPEAIDPQLEARIYSAIKNEPALLVPSARQQVSSWTSNVRTWTEQATGFAIAASVTAIMVFGVQTLNKPLTPTIDNSAITSLQLLNVDTSLIADQTEYSKSQEFLLELTRKDSLYGLQYMTPYVSVVNYSVPVKLKPTSDNVYYNLDKKSDLTDLLSSEKQKQKNTSDK